MALFYVAVYALDLFLPRKGELTLISYNSKTGSKKVKKDKKTGLNEALPEGSMAQYMWVEKSYIFQFPIMYYYLNGEKISQRKPNFSMVINGIPFFCFLAIGGVFGVFFKKRKHMDLRAAVLCLITGLLIIILGSIAYR